MKVIERSPIGGESGSAGITDRLKGIWQFGFSWDQDIQAQQVLIARLGGILDNSFTMISNVAIPESSLPVPLVLVGPIGVWTFYVTALKGIFRVKGESWYRLDDKSQHYKPSRPNLIRRSALMSRAINDYLRDKGFFLDQTQPVLFFAQPGIHIDAPEPPVRLLYSDGVDRFAAKLLEEKTVLDSAEIKRVTEILTKSKPGKPKKGEKLNSLRPPQELIGVGEFMLKPWQWIVIFVLATLMLITVIITAYIMLNF
ncbi:MAG: hypothetical protein ABUK20_06225 [Anaerolineales bacterium]